MKQLFHLNFRGLLFFKLLLFLIIIFLGLFIFRIEALGFYYCIVVLFLVSLIAIMINSKKLISESAQSIIKIIIDTFIENILIQFSGGLDSPFIFLLILDIFLGAYILPGKMMFILAVFISGFYAFFSAITYFKYLPSFLLISQELIPSPELYFYYVVFMRATIFIMMGFLASQLSGRIYSQRVKIEQMQNLTEKILYQMDSGLITIDSKDTIIYSNKAASNILGFSNEMLLGKKWMDVFFTVEKSWTCDIGEFYKRAYSIDGLELKVLKNDGKEIPLGIIISDFKDEEQRLSGRTIIFRDLTVYKEMEVLVLEQKKMKAIGELAATMAHEIKNPLASICGSLEVLRELKGFQDLKSKKLVDIILKESERLGRTLGEFLTFTGDLNLKIVKSDIKLLIEDVLMLMENHHDRNALIIIDFKYDSCASYTAHIDEDYFKQVAFNLILNALQAMNQNQGTLEIILNKIKQNNTNYLKMEVADQGPGVPEEFRKNLFKPFFTMRAKGIGLGLNVCAKIAQKHGWEIDYKPREPKGSIFSILIPEKEVLR